MMRFLIWILILLVPSVFWGDEVWNLPSNVSLSFPGESQYFPQIITDSKGNAHAVWYTLSRNTFYIVYYSHRATGNLSWDMPTQLSDELQFLPETTIQISLALDGAGNPIIAWNYIDINNGSTLQATIATSNYSLSDVNTINTGGVSSSFSLGENPTQSGGAMLVYQYFDGTNYAIKYSKWNGINWSAKQTIVDGAGSNTYFSSPQVTISSTGNVYVIWIQGDTYPYFNPYYSVYNGTTWSTFQLNSSNNAVNGAIIAPVITNMTNHGINNSRRVYAAWLEQSRGSYQILCANLNDTPTVYQVANSITSIPKALQITGVEVILGEGPVGVVELTDTFTVHTQNINAEGTWIANKFVRRNLVDTPHHRFDHVGNGVVVWTENTTNSLSEIYSSLQLYPSKNWSKEALLTSQNVQFPYSATHPKVAPFGVALDNLITATAVWKLDNGTIDMIQTSDLTIAVPEPVSPPIDLKVTRILQRSVMYGVYFNKIIVRPSPSPRVVAYKIYRNGTLIATITGNTYEDYSQPTSRTRVTYAVTAVDDSGHESSAISRFL